MNSKAIGTQVFLAEFVTIGIFVGIVFGLGKSAPMIVDAIARGQLQFFQLKAYAVLLILFLLLMWVVSRVLVWRIILGKPITAAVFLKAVWFGLQVAVVEWVLLGLVFWLGYRILSPVLLLRLRWVAYLGTYAITTFFLAPLIFNITSLCALALQVFLRQAGPPWQALKQKNLNRSKFIEWEKHVMLIAAGFVGLTLLCQLGRLLPKAPALIVMWVMFACFLAWSKLNLAGTVLR